MAAHKSLAFFEGVRAQLGALVPAGIGADPRTKYINRATGEAFTRRDVQTAKNLQRFGLKITPERAAMRPERLAARGPEPFRVRLARAYKAEHGLPNLRHVQNSQAFKDEYARFKSLQRELRNAESGDESEQALRRRNLYRFFDEYNELYDDEGDRYEEATRQKSLRGR